jgi:hypothetical protein
VLLPGNKPSLNAGLKAEMKMPHPLYRNFTTQAEIDAQYNAGASVPDAAACQRHYTDEAKRARETLDTFFRR